MRYRRPSGIRQGSPREPSIIHASRLRRAALPLEFLVPVRGLAPGGARPARAGAGLRRAGDHRRLLARRHRPGAPGRPRRRVAADRRQRARARLRAAPRPAGDRPRQLRQSLPARHPRAAPGDQGRLRRRPRRRRRVRGRPPRPVGAARPAVAHAARPRRHAGRGGSLGRRDLPRPQLARRRALRRRRRPAPPRAVGGARAVLRAAAGRRRRRPHARALPPRPPGHADRDPPRHPAGRVRLRAFPERRAPPALARAPRLRLSARAAGGNARRRRALPLLARRTALRIPRGDRAARHHAGRASRRAGRGRAAAALPGAGRARRRPRADRARAVTDRRARLRALLPHRPRHRRLRPRPGHPLPGPRLGRQLGGLLRAGHHRGRSGAQLHAVRALHQPRAQRAAGHRRRLRAPAARGSDPVHLRQVRPRPRGARRHAHHLPAEERGARRRQGAGARPRAGRPADPGVRLVGRPATSSPSASARRASSPTTR